MPLILDRGLRRSLLKKSSKYRRKAVRAAFAATRVVRDEEAEMGTFRASPPQREGGAPESLIERRKASRCPGRTTKF